MQKLLGLSCHDEVRSCYRQWVEHYLANMQTSRQEEWTQSIAVGSRTFVERVRDLLGFRAKGRKVTDDAQGCQLREPSAFYGGLLEIKKRRYGA
jgi:putative transposase